MTRQGDLIVVLTVVLAPLAKVIEFAALSGRGGPDLLAVLSVCAGWSSDPWNAVSAGFILGLVEDLIVGRALGMRATSLALAAFLASLLRRVINPDSLSSKIIAALASTTLADLMSWAILSSMGIAIASSHFVRAIWIPSALWSGLLIGPFEWAVRRTSGSLQSLWPSAGRKGRETAI